MQLINVDAIQAQSFQAALDRFTQMLRGCIVRPDARASANPASLGRDHQVLGIRRERFGDQFFADIGAVGISGVDKIHAQLHRPAQDGERAGAIFWRSPDSRSGKTHGSITQAMDGQFAAQGYGSRWRF